VRARALRYLAALLLGSLPARADTEACARTLREARRLHAAGELREAVREMDACTACGALADVCAETKRALREAVPSLAVTVHDCDGKALPRAAVFVDGVRVPQADRVELDPGPHDVRAALDGRTEEQTVVVAEGEKRSASLMLAASTTRPVPASAIVMGTVSVAAFAVATGLFVSLGGPDVRPTTVGLATPAAAVASQRTYDDRLLAASVVGTVALTALVATIVIVLTR